jgi:hypothetical protein
LAQAHFANQMMSMQNTFIAIKNSGEECQTRHCQHNSMDIGDKFQTENEDEVLRASQLLPFSKLLL